MASIVVTDVQVLDNPTQFTNEFRFNITFECLSPIKDDLEWNVLYIGSADSDKYDQLLDSVLLGPISVGLNNFVFQVNPPDISCIPHSEWLGITALLLTCSYHDREFIRVGYFVNNEYIGPELQEDPESIANARRVLIEQESKEEEDEDDDDDDDDEEEEEDEDSMVIDDEEPIEESDEGREELNSRSSLVINDGSSNDSTIDDISQSSSNAPKSLSINKSKKPLTPTIPPTLPSESNPPPPLLPSSSELPNTKDSHILAMMHSENQPFLSEDPFTPIEAAYEGPPRWYLNVNPNLIQRNVLADKPRVTLFNINWSE